MAGCVCVVAQLWQCLLYGAYCWVSAINMFPNMPVQTWSSPFGNPFSIVCMCGRMSIQSRFSPTLVVVITEVCCGLFHQGAQGWGRFAGPRRWVCFTTGCFIRDRVEWVCFISVHCRPVKLDSALRYAVCGSHCQIALEVACRESFIDRCGCCMPMP